MAAAAVELGATCVLIGWPEPHASIESVGRKLSEVGSQFEFGTIEMAANAIGCVPVAIILAKPVEALRNVLQKGLRLEPYWLPIPLTERHYERGARKETTGGGSGLTLPPPPPPLQRSFWNQFSAGFSYAHEVLRKPTHSGQLQQRLNFVQTAPSNTAKRSEIISLFNRVDEFRVDVDDLRDLLLLRQREQPEESAWLVVVASVMRDKLNVDKRRQLWTLPAIILIARVADWQDLVPDKQWEWSKLTDPSPGNNTLLHVLNCCLAEAFQSWQFTESAHMLCAMSMLKRFQAWSGRRVLETARCWTIFADSQCCRLEPLGSVLGNLQMHLLRVGPPASEELWIVWRAFYKRITSIEELTLLCSLAGVVGNPVPSQHAVSDAYSHGAVKQALRSVFKPPGDATLALCDFLRLLSPHERNFGFIVSAVVDQALQNRSDGFSRLHAHPARMHSQP
jgi:hypothetical protein